MSEALTPEQDQQRQAEIHAALLAKGVSDALVEKSAGIWEWLQERQAKLHSAYALCPYYRVDVVKALLSVGDVLLDEWQAEIVAVIGTWSPEDATFMISPLDPSCPPKLSAEAKRILEEDASLREIPEYHGGPLTDTTEDQVWLLAGALAMALDTEGLHVAQNGGKLVFLAIKGLRRLRADECQLDQRRASELIVQTGAPVRELFHQVNVMLHSNVEAQDPEFVEQVLPALLQDSVLTLERFVNELDICTNHARLADAPIAETFESLANQFRACLEKIDQHASQSQPDQALSALADTGVALEAALAAHQRSIA